jgi:hypothetical protein
MRLNASKPSGPKGLGPGLKNYISQDESGEINVTPLSYSNAIQDGSQPPIEVIVEDIPDSMAGAG